MDVSHLSQPWAGGGHSKQTVSRFGLWCILILKHGCFGVSCAHQSLLLWRNEILPWCTSGTDGSLRSHRAGFWLWAAAKAILCNWTETGNEWDCRSLLLVFGMEEAWLL